MGFGKILFVVFFIVVIWSFVREYVRIKFELIIFINEVSDEEFDIKVGDFKIKIFGMLFIDE